MWIHVADEACLPVGKMQHCAKPAKQSTLHWEAKKEPISLNENRDGTYIERMRKMHGERQEDGA